MSDTWDFAGSARAARRNFIDTAKTILNKFEVLLIEGPTGVGKTTFAIEFAHHLPQHSVSVFLRASSRWISDPLFARHNIALQIETLLDRDETVMADPSQDGYLRVLYLALQRRIRNQVVYFVIDGLDELPPAKTSTVASIIDILPFGYPKFRFVISIAEGNPPQLHPNTKTKNLTLPAFSDPEVDAYLADLKLPGDAVVDLKKVCRGLPAQLASARRSITAGTIRPGPGVPQYGNTLDSFFSLEWQATDPTDSTQLIVLSILAHDPWCHSAADLASLLDIDEGEVRDRVLRLNFVVEGGTPPTLSF